MKKINLFIALLTILTLGANAQRSTNAKDANYSFLKKEKALNIIFVYDGMTVGKNMTETDYVAEKVAEKNEKKPGDGDDWKKSWEEGKLSIYEPAFESKFSKKMLNAGINVTNEEEAHLTLIVKPTRIEPGFNIGITKSPAVVDFEFIFVETANKDNIVAQIVLSKVRGSDTFSVSGRIQFAYMVAGKKLAGYIVKKLK